MRRKRALKFITILALAMLFVLSSMVYAKGPRTVSNTSFAKASADGPLPRTLVNIGNWSYWIYYDGKSANDPDGNSGGVYPRGKTGDIFQDGLVGGVSLEMQQPSRFVLVVPLIVSVPVRDHMELQLMIPGMEFIVFVLIMLLSLHPRLDRMLQSRLSFQSLRLRMQ